jgi:hypothetical protein
MSIISYSAKFLRKSVSRSFILVRISLKLVAHAYGFFRQSLLLPEVACASPRPQVVLKPLRLVTTLGLGEA